MQQENEVEKLDEVNEALGEEVIAPESVEAPLEDKPVE